MVSATSLIWVSADSMQFRRFLLLYAACFIMAWYGTLIACCAYGWGYEQVGLLSGVFPRVLSSTDQHQTAMSNMLLFIVKDCVAHVLTPGCCVNIKGRYFKYWLLRGGGDRSSTGEAQALPDPEGSIWPSQPATDVENSVADDEEDGTNDTPRSPPQRAASWNDRDMGSVRV